MSEPPPYSDEDEALAEEIVQLSMRRLRPALPAALADELRGALVDQLLATASGRHKVRLFKASKGIGHPSGDVERAPGLAEGAGRKARPAK